MVGKMSLLKSLMSHWLGLVFLLQMLLLALQFHVIWPLEIRLFGPVTAYASIFFLPHACRVLAAWLLGPKAIFALAPAEVLFGLMVMDGDLPADMTFITFVIPAIAASTAVIAFELMRMMQIDAYPSRMAAPNWRGVVFAGCLASVLNSISGTFLKTYALPSEEIFLIIFRYIIGDTAGLLFCMLALMLMFRMADRARKPMQE